MIFPETEASAMSRGTVQQYWSFCPPHMTGVAAKGIVRQIRTEFSALRRFRLARFPAGRNRPADEKSRPLNTMEQVLIAKSFNFAEHALIALEALHHARADRIAAYVVFPR